MASRQPRTQEEAASEAAAAPSAPSHGQDDEAGGDGVGIIVDHAKGSGDDATTPRPRAPRSGLRHPASAASSSWAHDVARPSTPPPPPPSAPHQPPPTTTTTTTTTTGMTKTPTNAPASASASAPSTRSRREAGGGSVEGPDVARAAAPPPPPPAAPPPAEAENDKAVVGTTAPSSEPRRALPPSPTLPPPAPAPPPRAHPPTPTGRPQPDEVERDLEAETLLLPALPPDPSALVATTPAPAPAAQLNPTSPAALARSVRCAEPGHGGRLYLGSSDGRVYCYEPVPAEAGGSKDATAAARPAYRVAASRQMSASGKAVERVIPLPQVGLLVTLSESILSFLYIESLESVPNQVLPTLRGVATVVLDDAQSPPRTGGGGTGVDAEGLVSLCIVKRRQVLLAKVARDVWRLAKEVPLPGGANLARCYGDTLCVATASEYSLVKLDEARTVALGLPISQTSDSPSASVRPSIVAIPRAATAAAAAATTRRGGDEEEDGDGEGAGAAATCEFLITSHSQDMTLGVFIRPDGEPTPKLIEWPSHPRALALDGRRIVALLRNDTLEVHDVDTVQLVQRTPMASQLELRTLSQGYGRHEVLAPPMPPSAHAPPDARDDAPAAEALAPVRVAAAIDARGAPRFELGDVGGADAAARGARARALASRLSPRSTILVVAKNAVQRLLRRPRLARAFQLLREGRTREAVRVAEERWPPADARSEEAHLVRHVLRVGGLRALREMRVAQARECFAKAGLPPAVLASLHPLTAPLFRSGPAHDAAPMVVARQVGEEMARLRSFDSMIRDNLELNYCPPLDVERDAVLAELRRRLTRQTLELLRETLQAHRDSYGETAKNQKSGAEEEDEAVDTSLALVLAELDDGAALSALLRSPNRCATARLEPVLRARGMHDALWRLHRRAGELDKALDVLTRSLDGSLQGEEGGGEVSSGDPRDVVDMIESCGDADVAERYALWVVKRDAAEGLKLLTRTKAGGGAAGTPAAGGATTGAAEPVANARDAARLLEQLRNVDASAAEAFLVHSVLVEAGGEDEAMHKELVDLLLGRILSSLEDEKQRQSSSAIAREYLQGGYAHTFAAHLAFHADACLGDDRLRLAVLLQASSAYDVNEVLGRLATEPILSYELAIVLGKMRKHREALALLALEVGDACSAEAYCSQRGRVLGRHVVATVASERPALAPYAEWFARASPASQLPPKPAGAKHEDGRANKAELIEMLLGIYMSGKASDEERVRVAASHLLNTQASAAKLEAERVLRLVPDEWRVASVATLAQRSLRRHAHRAHASQLHRALALAQNLEVSEQVYARARALGGVIQDEVEEDEKPLPSLHRGDIAGDAVTRGAIPPDVPGKEAGTSPGEHETHSGRDGVVAGEKQALDEDAARSYAARHGDDEDKEGKPARPRPPSE